MSQAIWMCELQPVIVVSKHTHRHTFTLIQSNNQTIPDAGGLYAHSPITFAVSLS